MKPSGKRSLSDKLSRRPTATRDVRRNPFELFLTKAKHVVAGRTNKPVFNGGELGKFQKKPKPGKKQNVQIETQGLRSVSRNVAITNRKNTLLTEYKTRTKSNKTIDRRLGEKDATMTIEDKMMERVMFERKQSAKTRKGLFNLRDADDEDMGFGQSLAEVERLDDEEDEDMKGVEEEDEDILGEKFVSEHHFGGGLLKKVSRVENGAESESLHPRQVKADRAVLIDDIIAESKEKKYAKQSELDEIRDMTEKLDEKWKDFSVRNLITSTFSQSVPEPPVESYDSLVKMLQFDSKAKASNKLKSESEIAKDLKEELEKAEKNRLKPEQPKIGTGSKIGTGLEFGTGSKIGTGLEFGTGSEIGTGLKFGTAGLELLEPEMDELEELESENGDVEVELSEDEVESSGVEVETALVAPPVVADTFFQTFSGKTEIPFVIPIPEKRKQLEALFANRKNEEILIIVKRIMQYFHISLAEKNREKLTKFFKLFFDFALSFCDESPKNAVRFWKLLTPSFLELVKISKKNGSEFLKKKIINLTEIVSKKTNYVLLPSTVFFLKFIFFAFSNDDFFQPIFSATNFLLGKILMNFELSLKNRRSFLTSLFFATLTTENVLLSKKYFPELIYFLEKVLTSQFKKKNSNEKQKNSNEKQKNLNEKQKNLNEEKKNLNKKAKKSVSGEEKNLNGEEKKVVFGEEMKFSLEDVVAGDWEMSTVTSEDGVKAVFLSLGLLEKLIPVYSGLPAYQEVFGRFEKLFDSVRGEEFSGGQEFLGGQEFSEMIKAKIERVCSLVVEHRQSRQFVTFLKKKPTALTLLEPRIDDKFDRAKSAKKTVVKRLQHDKKRAMKGAKRELRRDTQFIQRVQLEEQIKKDVTRVKKVKEIFTNLYSQESEHKAMQRQKAKFKI